MCVIDYPNIHEKLEIGDKILVDYGGVIMSVIGFEPEEKYLQIKQYFKALGVQSGDKIKRHIKAMSFHTDELR